MDKDEIYTIFIILIFFCVSTIIILLNSNYTIKINDNINEPTYSDITKKLN